MSIEKVDDHQFRITWEIDFWADSYEEAAKQGWDVLKEAVNTASILVVEDLDADEGTKQFDMFNYAVSGKLEDILED